MKQALSKYLPEGEVLEAGIHGIGLESEIRQVFRKCICDGDKIMPNEHGITLEVSKSKYSKCDVYIGISANYLILAECDIYKHLYEFHENPDTTGVTVREVDHCIRLEDIGNCFALKEIRSCVVKNVWMGAVNCTVTLNNGSVIKLQMPKRGGVGNGMSHHAEYRDRILAVLGAMN